MSLPISQISSCAIRVWNSKSPRSRVSHRPTPYSPVWIQGSFIASRGWFLHPNPPSTPNARQLDSDPNMVSSLLLLLLISLLSRVSVHISGIIRLKINLSPLLFFFVFSIDSDFYFFLCVPSYFGFSARSCHNSRKLGLFASGVDFPFHVRFFKCDFGIKKGKTRDLDAPIAKVGH